MINRKLRMGMIGGGKGAFIGALAEKREDIGSG